MTAFFAILFLLLTLNALFNKSFSLLILRGIISKFEETIASIPLDIDEVKAAILAVFIPIAMTFISFLFKVIFMCILISYDKYKIATLIVLFVLIANSAYTLIKNKHVSSSRPSAFSASYIFVPREGENKIDAFQRKMEETQTYNKEQIAIATKDMEEIKGKIEKKSFRFFFVESITAAYFLFVIYAFIFIK